jgi:hypothetical protein
MQEDVMRELSVADMVGLEPSGFNISEDYALDAIVIDVHGLEFVMGPAVAMLMIEKLAYAIQNLETKRTHDGEP